MDIIDKYLFLLLHGLLRDPYSYSNHIQSACINYFPSPDIPMSHYQKIFVLAPPHPDATLKGVCYSSTLHKYAKTFGNRIIPIHITSAICCFAIGSLWLTFKSGATLAPCVTLVQRSAIPPHYVVFRQWERPASSPYIMGMLDTKDSLDSSL
ncbi:hypothetical protein WA026_004994 [Henosepilachna vigintioctopunctata]|uniref:Uncharacterized protein n=1 Tax=Henosepilachna vigintioctopunctata TaxID=420089 RepID=A0AAW1UW40_9CUCU